MQFLIAEFIVTDKMNVNLTSTVKPVGEISQRHQNAKFPAFSSNMIGNIG